MIEAQYNEARPLPWRINGNLILYVHIYIYIIKARNVLFKPTSMVSPRTLLYKTKINAGSDISV